MYSIRSWIARFWQEVSSGDVRVRGGGRLDDGGNLLWRGVGHGWSTVCGRGSL